MSTTDRKLFSYDREEDADIHELFQKIPKRQHSKYIRMALRLLKEQQETGTTTYQPRTISTDITNETEPEETSNQTQNIDDFEDISDDILNMGK